MESHEEPLVQLSDLFAGMVRYSHEEGETCCGWIEANPSPEQQMIPGLSEEPELKLVCSRTQECRYLLIGNFYKTCRKHKLGISIRTKKYLWTPNPMNPINFWHYTPQGDYDKSPKA